MERHRIQVSVPSLLAINSSKSFHKYPSSSGKLSSIFYLDNISIMAQSRSLLQEHTALTIVLGESWASSISCEISFGALSTAGILGFHDYVKRELNLPREVI